MLLDLLSLLDRLLSLLPDLPPLLRDLLLVLDRDLLEAMACFQLVVLNSKSKYLRVYH